MLSIFMQVSTKLVPDYSISTYDDASKPVPNQNNEFIYKFFKIKKSKLKI